MVKWVDNECLYGWYYETEEGFLYGDGTKATAYREKKYFESR